MISSGVPHEHVTFSPFFERKQHQFAVEMLDVLLCVREEFFCVENQLQEIYGHYLVIIL